MPFISAHKEPDGAWRFFMNTLVPIVLIPVPVVLTVFYPEYKVDHHLLYVVMLLGIFWSTGSLAFVITAFIPLVLFPLLGIQFAGKVAANFCQEQVALLLGQFVLGGSLVATNFPQYLSAKFYLYTNNHMDRTIIMLFLGSLLTSMLLSSTIGAVVMCEVALSMLEDRVRDFDEDEHINSLKMRASAIKISPLTKPPTSSKLTIVPDDGPKESNIEDIIEDPFYNNYLTRVKRRYLMVVYSGCNIGGLLFTFGSPATNFFYSCGRNRKFEIAGEKNFSKLILVSKGIPVPLAQISWVMYTGPLMLLLAIVGVLYWLLIFSKFFPLIKPHGRFTIFRRPPGDEHLHSAYVAQFISIKTTRFERLRAILVFSCLLICSALMLVRDPRTFPGWIELIPKKDNGTETLAEDSAVVFLMIIVLCGLPAFQGSTTEERSEPIMKWGPASKFVMWNVIFLFSGQNMLAEGANITNVTKAVSGYIIENDFKVGVLLLIVLCMTCIWGSLTTSVVVNTVLTRVAKTYPMYGTLALPLTAMMNLNFVMPVATPPNAITTIASFYDVRARHMLKYGFVLQVLVLFILYGYHIGFTELELLDFP